MEEAPRYATLWLQVREIQMGTLSTGRKEVRRFRNAMATLVTFTDYISLVLSVFKDRFLVRIVEIYKSNSPSGRLCKIGRASCRERV